MTWWKVALHSEAPRSIRATVATMALIAFYRLVKPFDLPLLVPDASTLERASRIIDRSAATYANLALRGDEAVLFSHAQDAFLMYVRRGRCWVALGEPVGPEQSARELLWQFYSLCDRFDGWCVLFEISGKWRSQCNELGLDLITLGEEARVCLTDFTLNLPAKKKIA